MLKLSYTENGFLLEYLSQSLDEWLSDRVLLYLRATSSIFVEPSSASFLLAGESKLIEQLLDFQADQPEILSVAVCDAEYVEVSLEGVWLATTAESEEGIFICEMETTAELCLFQLWELAQSGLEVTRD
ncbi:MAG: hypothetical protein D6756_07990 [Cyanobacteria bacterium J083]|nr:MAG: hypothetical protein D6756_07990 [Cyanobacteria bacterium J083]